MHMIMHCSESRAQLWYPAYVWLPRDYTQDWAALPHINCWQNAIKNICAAIQTKCSMQMHQKGRHGMAVSSGTSLFYSHCCTIDYYYYYCYCTLYVDRIALFALDGSFRVYNIQRCTAATQKIIIMMMWHIHTLGLKLQQYTKWHKMSTMQVD